MLRRAGQSARRAAAQCGPSECQLRRRARLATMDPDTDPDRTDHRRRATGHDSVVTGPSLASTSPAAGRGRGSMIRRAAIGLALVSDVQRRDRGRTPGDCPPWALSGRRPRLPPPARRRRTSASSAKPGTSSTRKYVGADELNDKELIYGAINGMTEAVGDTGHTSFLTPEERAARANDLSGQYVGIGVRIDTAEDGLPLIIGVFPDSPAEKGGLVVGDEIVAVDGKPTDRPHDRRRRQLGARRGRLLGHGHGPSRRRRARSARSR